MLHTAGSLWPSPGVPNLHVGRHMNVQEYVEHTNQDLRFGKLEPPESNMLVRCRSPHSTLPIAFGVPCDSTGKAGGHARDGYDDDRFSSASRDMREYDKPTCHLKLFENSSSGTIVVRILRTITTSANDHERMSTRTQKIPGITVTMPNETCCSPCHAHTTAPSSESLPAPGASAAGLRWLEQRKPRKTTVLHAVCRYACKLGYGRKRQFLTAIMCAPLCANNHTQA